MPRCVDADCIIWSVISKIFPGEHAPGPLLPAGTARRAHQGLAEAPCPAVSRTLVPSLTRLHISKVSGEYASAQPLCAPSVLILWAPIQGPGQSGYSRHTQESKHTWDRGKHSAWYVDSNTKDQRNICHIMRRKMSKSLYLTLWYAVAVVIRVSQLYAGNAPFILHPWLMRCSNYTRYGTATSLVETSGVKVPPVESYS